MASVTADRWGLLARRGAGLLCATLLAASCASATAWTTAPPTVRPLRVEPDAAAPLDDRLPAEPEKTAHEPQPWPFDVLDYDVRLTLDFERESLRGAVTVRFTDLADGVPALPLDAAGMRVLGVRDGAGAPVTFTQGDGRLLLTIPGGSQTGTERAFTVRYETTPSRGLHFMQPPPGRPEWGRHVWSQGECEDTRWWIPCHDAPDDRATHSMTVTLPAGMQVIAAGRLLGRSVDGDAATWRFRMDVPHVSYLMTLVAGDLFVREDASGAVPLQYAAAPYDAPHLAGSLRRTPDVLAFLSAVTGRPYPYVKYAQSCVRGFVFGGMENISATTLTDRTVHPPSWEPVRTSDGLIAHEAAHQWFGDLITCREWSHVWLNEGFASYFTLLWKEHDEGRGAFLAAIRGTMNGALGAAERSKRAVVSNVYAKPFDLFFDGQAYGGGAARLHALRVELGDERFFAAIRLYVEKNAARSVTTADFEAAVSEAAGEDMSWWFDQWLRKPGRPKLTVSWTWIEDDGVLRVSVKQTHTEKAFPQAYRLALDIVCDARDGGAPERRRLRIDQREQTFDVALRVRPVRVDLDPDRGLLARLDVERPFEDWLDAAQSARSAADQLDAVAHIGKLARGKKETPQRSLSRRVLRQIVLYEPHFIQTVAVAEINRQRQDWSRDILLEALAECGDARVRHAIVNALGDFDASAGVERALRRVLGASGDLLRAAALRALAKQDADGAFEMLAAALDGASWHSHVRGAALAGFADLGDESAFELLVAAAAPDADPWTRKDALAALGRMGAARPEYTEAVLRHLRDPRPSVRRAAAGALAQLADAGAVPALMDAFRAATWPGNRKALRRAIVACRKAAVTSGELVTVEAVRAADLRARHAEIRDTDDEASRAEAKRLATELRALGVAPRKKAKKAKKAAQEK